MKIFFFDKGKKIEELKSEDEISRKRLNEKIENLEIEASNSKTANQSALNQKDSLIGELKQKLRNLKEFSEEKNQIENRIIELESIIDRQQREFAEGLHERDIQNIKNLTKYFFAKKNFRFPNFKE